MCVIGQCSGDQCNQTETLNHLILYFYKTFDMDALVALSTYQQLVDLGWWFITANQHTDMLYQLPFVQHQYPGLVQLYLLHCFHSYLLLLVLLKMATLVLLFFWTTEQFTSVEDFLELVRAKGEIGVFLP